MACLSAELYLHGHFLAHLLMVVYLELTLSSKLYGKTLRESANLLNLLLGCRCSIWLWVLPHETCPRMGYVL
jgi:hypothetical protein